jgi:hypothetical protein
LQPVSFLGRTSWRTNTAAKILDLIIILNIEDILFFSVSLAVSSIVP